jgi:hypothetical protein
MQITGQIPFEAVVQAWLKAEWYSDFFDPVRNYVPQPLIDDEDFSNQQNNELRYWLLRALRFNMLLTLPAGITWYSATYEIADIARTFIERYSKPHVIEKKKSPRAASNASS